MIKVKLYNAPLFTNPSFLKVFQVDGNASTSRIGAALPQEGHLVEYFSKKVSKPRQKWTTYELEFYLVVRALKYWEHCLVQLGYVLVGLLPYRNLLLLLSISLVNRMK